jgi:hypothetical protein
MNKTLAAAFGSMAIGCGAAIAYMWSADEGGRASGAPRAPALASAEQSSLATEVAAQRRSLTRLEEAIASIERSVIETREENEKLRDMLNDLLGTNPGAATAKAPGAPRPGTLASPSAETVAVATPARDPAVLVGEGVTNAAGVYAFSAVEAQREQEIKSVLAKVEAEKQKAEQERAREREIRDAKRRVDEMAKRLNLSPDQTQAMADLLVERGDKSREMWVAMRDGQMTREQSREMRQTLRTEYDAKLQQVLTPAQFQELQAIRQEQERQGGGDMNWGPQFREGRREVRQGTTAQPR